MSAVGEFNMQYLKKEIRNKILASAIDEFKEHGYSDASIRNIANNAEISLGNVYRYFTNKEALYFAVINPFMESIRQSIEKDFAFEGKSMKEVSEVLVAFLMQYNDELIIIRKGNTVHYDSFVKYIVKVIAQKLKLMLEENFPEIDVKITNPDFAASVAEGFLTSLFLVLDGGDSADVQERYIRELITFYFGRMKDRFYHFDLD
mgnify:FL=1